MERRHQSGTRPVVQVDVIERRRALVEWGRGIGRWPDPILAVAARLAVQSPPEIDDESWVGKNDRLTVELRWTYDPLPSGVHAVVPIARAKAHR